MFPRPVWEARREVIANWPMSARPWQRIFLGNASDVEMDSAGRVLISPELRTATALKPDSKVMLLGMGSHFEIWDVAAHEKNEAETLAAGLPPDLAQFSF
jgi:MraZ protein